MACRGRNSANNSANSHEGTATKVRSILGYPLEALGITDTLEQALQVLCILDIVPNFPYDGFNLPH